MRERASSKKKKLANVEHKTSGGEVAGAAAVRNVPSEIENERMLGASLPDAQEARAPIELFARVLEQVQDGFVALDRDWCYVYVNDKAAQMLNRQKPEDLIGRHIWTEYPEGIGQPFVQAYRTAMETQQPVYLEEYYEPWDRWFENRIYPSPNGLTIYFTDITARKQAEEALHESEERYRLLVDSSPYAIGIHQDGKLVFVNPAAVRLFGARNTDDLIGKSIADFIHPDTRAAAVDRVGRLLQGETGLYPREERYVRLDGSAIPVEVTSVPFIYHGRLAVQVIALDITERKLFEEAERKQRVLAEALRDTAAAVNSTLDLEEVFDHVLDSMGRVIEYDSADILLIEAGIVRPVRTHGYNKHTRSEEVAPLRLVLEETRNLREVATTGRTQVIADSHEYEGWQDVASARWIRSFAVAPIRRGPEVIGFLTANKDTPGFYKDSDGAGLQAFADQVSLAIQNASLYRQAQIEIAERKETEDELRRSYDRLRSLAARLTEVETAERRQLAQELHDQVGQNLTALGINLNIVRAQLPADSDGAVGERIEDTLVLLEETTRRIRDVMTELRPGVLEDYGIVAALRWYAGQFSARTQVPVTMLGEDITPRLPAHIQDVLYRVALEALNNVAKHAQATEVTITVSASMKTARMVIADNGIGFGYGRAMIARQEGHMGLEMMRERIEAVGGTFQLESASGKGTRISLGIRR